MQDKRLLSIMLAISIPILLILSLMTLAPAALARSQGSPVIKWSQKRVTARLTPGAVFSTTVTFSSTMDLQNVTLHLTPSLQSVVTITPSTLATITAGIPNPVEIVVVIPASTKRNAFNGTLKIQMGRRTLAAPLSLKINVVKQPKVKIADFRFTPSRITVHAGQTVVWSNAGPSSHTTTSDTGVWDSGSLSPGSTFSQTFNSAGTFTYHCMIHPFMHGTVTVTP